MADCVQFKETLVKKLVDGLPAAIGYNLLPEVVRKVLEEQLKESFKNVKGKVCIEGSGEIDGCNKGTREKPDFTARCCKFKEEPKLKVRDFPNIGTFPAGAFSVTVEMVPEGAITWDKKCKAVSEGGECKNDSATCRRPVLTIKVTVTAAGQTVGAVTFSADLEQGLSLDCK